MGNLSLIQGRDKELEEFERQNEEQKITRISLDEQCKNLLKTTQHQEELNIQKELQKQIDNFKNQLEICQEEKSDIEKNLKLRHENHMKDLREEHLNEMQIMKQNLNKENKQL